MWEFDAKLKQLPAWELAIYPGEMEADGPSVSLAPPVGSKPQKEDQGDIDEDGGHLYNGVKMLYQEGSESSPVFTQGTGDAIVIVSNLSPFYVQHEFSISKQSDSVTNMAFLLGSSFFRT